MSDLSYFMQKHIDQTKALVAIQELHAWNRLGFCKKCQAFNCPTRRLADAGLGE